MRRSIGELGFGAISAVCLGLAMLISCLLTSHASASDGVAADALVDRAGLTVDWFTHSGAGARSQLVDWQLVVNEDKATTFFTITAGRYRETFSEKKISPFGEPYGVDGAVEYASIRKEVLEAEFKNDGITDVEVKISQYTLPESTIYFVTSNGVVKAIDADTGEMKWSTIIGNGRLPSIGVGANHQYVAALNGSSVYCLDATTGKLLWNKKCRYAVSAPPSVSDEKVYVPLVNGRLESFSIKDKGVNSTAFVATGVGRARPLVTEKTVAWPTDRGDMNVAARYGSYHGVSYQLNADRPIVSSPTFRDDTFFVSSLDGFVYAVHEDRGSVTWQVSTGASISQSPIPLGDHLFVINDHQELFKMKIDDGSNADGWERPRSGVAKFVGASKENLYVLDQFGNLKVLSQGSGTVLSSVAFGRVDMVLSNLESDRLYVANRGMIQCLREISRPIPHFHLNDEFGPVEVDAPGAAMNQDGDAGDQPRSQGDLEDPFKTLDANEDPFKMQDADPAKPLDPENDPFAGDKSNDPFAGNKTDNSQPPVAKPGDGNSGVEDDPFK